MTRNPLPTLALTAWFAAAALWMPAAGHADPAALPCDWVTAAEAADIIGGPVTATPRGDEPGSTDLVCSYSKGPGLEGVMSDLRLPGALPDGAASAFAGAVPQEGTTTVVDGLGRQAKCVFDQRTTPPSTTLLVLLDGDRLYRAQGTFVFCDTLTRFAQVAVSRIG
jgi:hypothetical protein